MTYKPTPPQLAALADALSDGHVSTHSHNAGTVHALARRGLLVLVDRFASGVCKYRITPSGRAALSDSSSK